MPDLDYFAHPSAIIDRKYWGRITDLAFCAHMRHGPYRAECIHRPKWLYRQQGHHRRRVQDTKQYLNLR